ncbi:zinc finger X-linked protein ZXDB-like [Cervus canadensis]|uniref:zinc finger X-linked protein ZXDB-like n=1 Tax=Cervus canadensis TaxID=1574408 RepID=UPI001CA32723|nr:zinc finger X-linked protein ZXDB-like [Cervus canadensis]
MAKELSMNRLFIEESVQKVHKGRCWGPRQGAGLRLLRGSGSSGASRTQRWEYPRLLSACGTRQDGGGGGGGGGDDFFLVLLDPLISLPEDVRWWYSGSYSDMATGSCENMAAVIFCGAFYL